MMMYPCSRSEASSSRFLIVPGNRLTARSLLYLSTAMCLIGTATAWALTTRGTDAAAASSLPADLLSSTPAPATRARDNGSAALAVTNTGRNASRLADDYQTSEALEIASNKSVTLRDEDDDSEDAGNDNGKEDNEDGDQAYNENENYLDSYDDEDSRDGKERDEDGEEVDLDNDDGTA